MKRPQIQIALFAICLVGVLLSRPQPALGCVLLLEEFTVGPDFVVAVRNEGKAVTDMAVEILREKGPKETELALQGKTDRKGEFRVRSLALGEYILHVGKGSAFVESAFLHVKAKGSRGARKEVRMAWPSGKALRTVRFRGILRDHVFNERKAEYDNGNAISGASVEIRDARSQNFVTRTTTHADGSFDVGELRSGIYVAQFAEGDLLLHVVEGRDKFPNGVELGISFTTCGLFYTASPLPKARKRDLR